MWRHSQNTRYDSWLADLAFPTISQDDDRAELPKCKTCKKTLNNTLDRQKISNKWWANCKSCRTTNTIKRREKRDSGLITPRHPHTPRKPTESLIPEQPWWKKRTEKNECGTCGKHPYKPRVSACGHLMCDPCYEDIMVVAAESGHTNASCKACGQLFFAAVSYELEEDMLLVKATKKRKIVQECLDYGNDVDHGDVSKTNPEKSALITTDCSVCGDTGPAKRCPKLSACTHKPDVCLDCFLGWLNSQIDSTAWEQIQCPSSGCGRPITHADVKKYGSDDLFARFDELSMRAFLSNDPNFRYCLAEGCNSGQIHDTGSEGNIFRCNACDFRICTVHDVPFHTGETCAQYDERRRREEEQCRKEDEDRQKQNELSRAEIQTSTTKCPGCKVPIHKYIACDHMTCSRCQFQFCYVCRAPYQGKDGIWTAGNKVHSTECKYHPDMLPDYQDTGSEDTEPEGTGVENIGADEFFLDFSD